MSGCAGSTGPDLGLSADSKLTACPSSPNCVCSDVDGSHAIDALATTGDPGEAWQALLAYVDAQPRFEVVARDDGYLRVASKTRILRFVDDVEFHLRPGQQEIAIRSASRVGYSDLGTNRRRLESVRDALAANGVVKPAS